MSPPPDKIGKPLNRPGQWVQTERAAHEAWAGLINRKPRAAMLLHHLVAILGEQNAVVVSQVTLGRMMGVHERTVMRAVADLAAENWIQVVKIGRGKESAYIVNDKVAWSGPRDGLRQSLFTARVVADSIDQDPATIEDTTPLRRIPTIYPGERQLPSGPGLAPPSQPFLHGMEPDLPATHVEGPEQMDVETYIESRADEHEGR